MKDFIANAEKKLDTWGEKLEKINITYPADLVTGILFLVVSVIILLIMAAFKGLIKNERFKAVIDGIKPCVIGIILATGAYMILSNCFQILVNKFNFLVNKS